MSPYTWIAFMALALLVVWNETRQSKECRTCSKIASSLGLYAVLGVMAAVGSWLGFSPPDRLP